MSAQILGSVSHEDKPGGTFQGTEGCYASGKLGVWMLQRFPFQKGRWSVQIHIRVMCVAGYAVQDDFGDLQMVEV